MKTIILPIAAATLAFVFFTYSNEEPQKRQAQSFVIPSIKTQYENALRIWEDKITSDPFSIQARIHFAENAIALARATGEEQLYTKADTILSTGLRQHPENIAAKVLRLRCKLAMHQFQYVLNELTLLTADGKNQHLLGVLGDAALGLGEYEQAHRAYEQFAKLAPGYAAWVRLAHTLDLFGRSDESLHYLTMALQASDSLAAEPQAWTRLRLGIFYLQKDALDQAQKYFSESLAIAPDYYLALEHLAEVHEARHEYAVALPLLERAVAIQAAPALLMRLAVVEQHLGNMSKAERLKQKALHAAQAAYESNPAHAREFAEVLLATNAAPKKVLKLAREDYRMRPQDIGANQLMAKALKLAGRLDEARLYQRKSERFSA